tara:strand:- start:649 stop:1641 length:993 start_codon:yes stop_codon:yes gene_type:complete
LQRIKKTDFLDDIDHSLIDYANLKKTILFKQNGLLSLKEAIVQLKNADQTIPILIRNNKKLFSFYKKDLYCLKKNMIDKYIFFSNKKKYLISENFSRKGLCFVSKCKLNRKYLNLVDKVINFNLDAQKKIKKIIKKNQSVIAFQTRNIPHLAHEAIIKSLLKKFSHVVINPVLGPKKKGDISNNALSKCYEYLINTHYRNRLSYIPIISNMYYAGPKEAIHHARIREFLGFENFYVGRDHAGALNFYNPLSATKFIKKNDDNLKIKIITSKGGVYCSSCRSYKIKGTCNHNTIDVSGTAFRHSLKNKKIFIHARKDLQIFIYKKIKKIFN